MSFQLRKRKWSIGKPQAFSQGFARAIRRRTDPTSAEGTLVRTRREGAQLRRMYKTSNPVNYSLRSLRPYEFERRIEQSVAINQSTGWGGFGNCLAYSFSLQQIAGYVNGTFQYGLNMPSYTEFTNLFDYYRIKGVKISMFYTNNDNPISATTTGLPLFLLCNDFDDVTSSETNTTMLERAGTRYVQPNTLSPFCNHYLKPCPQAISVQTSGAGADTNVASAISQNQWLNTGNPLITHYGVKIVYDNQGRTTATDIGSVTFCFSVMFEFKGYR